MIKNCMEDKLFKLIKACDVVSFDVFDTLISRKCNPPEAVFAYVAQAMGRYETDFVAKRVETERKLRKTQKKEVTISAIYSQIESCKDLVDQYIRAEEDAEMRLCVCNREMKQVYDNVKQYNKHIYIISDMYMNSEFIDKLLKNNGYGGYEHLYVSSEFGITKSTGKLFTYVLNRSEYPASRIVHIGDNYKSDYFMPRLKGMKSYWYRT